MIQWTVENDALYGMYVFADRANDTLAKAIEMWLETGMNIVCYPQESSHLVDTFGYD
jgi:hypothetical protein